MGKPFFEMKLVQNDELLTKLRELPDRSQRNVRRKIVTELVPWLEARANELMSEGMVLPSSPFAFGTQRSRKYYFWLIHNNPTLVDDFHWIRTLRIEQSWQFEASDRLRAIQIHGRNAIPEARYVFGPYQVAGHRNTGWDQRAEEVRQILQQESRREISRMWRDAVREALAGQG